MPVSGDTRQALKLLERIQVHLQESEAAQLSPSVGDDLNTLISVLDSPVFNSILNIQDSLQELKRQLHKHPSILPVDFDISPTTGELLLNVPADPIPLQNSDSYEPSSDEPNYYDGHIAKTIKSEEMEPSPEMSSIIVAPPEYALSAITTESYAEEFQRTIDQGAQGREIHTLQLFKPEGSSLGFSVVGLRSEQKGELGIFIQEIQPNGIAGRDARLCEGDQILAIDGQPLDSNISHQQAISILQQARGLVELVVARGGINHSPPSDNNDMVLSTEWAQVECVELVNDGSGLGFGIIGGRSTGVVVKTILPGGVADRDGRLQSGDHILQIGEVNLRGMGSEQVASVLRQSGQRVRLVVARPVEPPGSALRSSRAPLVPTRILSDPEEVERHLAVFAAGGGEPLPPYRGSPTGGDPAFAYRRELLDGEAPFPSSQCRGYRGEVSDELPEMETFEVELVKDQQGLGITIAGYVCEKEEISGIFVKSIAKGSAADMCGQIRVNDQIIEVDGRPLHGYTNHDAVEVLRSTGKSVKLRLARYLRGAKYQQLQLAIATGELSYPSFPTIQAQVHEAKLLAEAANKDVDVNDINLLIDDDYATPLLPRVEAAIQAKWSQIMGSEYEIVVAQLSKFREGGGLGISLEGTVEVEDGKEVRPHHYIRSILPDGPVGVNGRLQSGDELLEVNGDKLLGMNHHGVVATLKELPMHVRMVCARRPPALEDTLPASHLQYDLSPAPDFGGPRAFGGSLTSLAPSPERLVKAKSDGSLAVGAPPPLDSSSRLKSRSLEPLTGLAMWSSEPQIIELTKGDRGLGFSILDYQDPMNPNETVIVIRSLVPGGVAQQDGRLIPGDRLLFVNDTNLENASLDAAVQALKGAPKGVVRIGVAKPLPLPESGQQMSIDNSPTLPDLRSSFDLPPRLNLNLDFEQKISGEKQVLPSFGKQSILQLLDSPVKTIRIQRGANIFGLSVNMKESVGVLVTSVTPGSAADKDGRIHTGDVLLALNGTSLMDAEPSKVGGIFRSIDKSEADIIVQFIPSDTTEHRSSVSSINSFRFLQRSQTKSDEEEDEYFDVSDSEPPDLPPNPPPTLVSDLTKVHIPQIVSSTVTEVTSHPKLSPTRLLPFEHKSLTVKTKISPIAIPMRPTSISPKPPTTPVATAPKPFDVGSLVSKVKPTVPFKPIRTSLSPKDAFPARTKPRSSSTLESLMGSDLSRQWGSERTVELFRDPSKGLGISIISGKVDHSVRAGIFIKNVLPDSPAGWNGTLKRGDRILEVSGIDLRNATHAQAVDVIKNASNPVIFAIQSLVPLPKTSEAAGEVVVPTTAASPIEQTQEPDKSVDVEVIPESKAMLLPYPDIASASSSNSSSRETTIKRSPSSSKNDLPIPSDNKKETSIVVSSNGSSIPKPTRDEAEDILPAPPLAKGKALTAKGIQIDSGSAGNVKLTPAEKAIDAEKEDEFGYTKST